MRSFISFFSFAMSFLAKLYLIQPECGQFTRRAPQPEHWQAASAKIEMEFRESCRLGIVQIASA